MLSKQIRCYLDKNLHFANSHIHASYILNEKKKLETFSHASIFFKAFDTVLRLNFFQQVKHSLIFHTNLLHYVGLQLNTSNEISLLQYLQIASPEE